MFGFVEANGSLVWYGLIRGQTGIWGLLASAINSSSWICVKFVPLHLQHLGITSSVPYRVSHNMQYIMIWFLRSISRLSTIKATDREDIESASSSTSSD